MSWGLAPRHRYDIIQLRLYTVRLTVLISTNKPWKSATLLVVVSKKLLKMYKAFEDTTMMLKYTLQLMCKQLQYLESG